MYGLIHPPKCFPNTGDMQSETCSTASHHRCICVASSSKGIGSVTMPTQASTYIQWREIKEGSMKKMDCTAVLKGNMLGEKQEHKVPFTLDSSAPALSLPVVHHLAAKALIADWENEYKEKKSIVDLSIESSVTPPTLPFAIDEESSEPVNGAMKTYDIRAVQLRRSRMSPMRRCI